MSTQQILGGQMLAPGQTAGQTAGSIIGAVIGAMVGGPAGAFVSASIPAHVGQLIEPEGARDSDEAREVRP